MKNRRCVSIQIFLFQLLLFWWAYCSLFPWHPAAILQLLGFTSIKEGKKKGLRSGFSFIFGPENLAGQAALRRRNSRYHCSHRNHPYVQLMSSPEIMVWIPKQELGSTSLLLVSSLPFHAGSKLKLQQQLSDPPRTDWSRVMVMSCQTPVESNGLVQHI